MNIFSVFFFFVVFVSLTKGSPHGVKDAPLTLETEVEVNTEDIPLNSDRKEYITNPIPLYDNTKIFTDILKTESKPENNFLNLQLHKSSSRRFNFRPECDCGAPNWNSRIKDGDDVNPPHKYPWMTLIYIQDNGKRLSCTGTIIERSYILTAAHCFKTKYNDAFDLPLENITVIVGDFSKFKSDDIPGVTKKVEVDAFILHQNYVYEEYYANDIALIRLKSPIDLTSYNEIKPVCLPDLSDTDFTGEMTAAGWGLLNDNKQAIKLQETTVYVDYCNPNDYYPQYLCLNGTKQPGFLCKGDSGGPIMRNIHGRYEQIGIVSHFTSFVNGGGKINCASVDGMMLVTNIPSYLHWIARYVPIRKCSD